VPDPVTARVRALVDGAIDRVFDEPFDVRTGEELEELVAAGPPAGSVAPAAASLAAFVATATPIARRALVVASKSGKVAGRIPMPSAKAVRIGLATIPLAVRLNTVTRRGVRELQLLASYVITKLRAAGAEPDRDLVRAITLSLYLDPARRPVLDVAGGRALGAIGRQWVLRTLGGDAESAVRARARRQAEALDRLDLGEFADQWTRRSGRPPELTAG
jgi:hypothetical protein